LEDLPASPIQSPEKFFDIGDLARALHRRQTLPDAPPVGLADQARVLISMRSTAAIRAAISEPHRDG
jgi:hypothetical protein